MSGQPNPVRVRSFDVFDTVLTRTVGAPEALLPLAAEEASRHGLPSHVPPSAVAGARRRVEVELEAVLRRPPTLQAIHDEVAHRLNLSPAHVELLVAAEEQVERRLSVLVPGADAMLAEARSAAPGGSLVFVSDTPHRPAFLQELLTKAGAWREGDRLYCSADRGVSKAHGGLYDLVAEDLAVAASAVSHVGDDLASDVAAARVQGWASSHRDRARLNRYEKLWESESGLSDGLGSRIAGASRLARLEAGERGAPSGVASVAAGVVGPLLLGHALWLAARVHQSGLRRLYFVARDGEVMLEVARRVLPLLAPQVECRYVYGSRQAWEFAGLAASPESLQGWVTVPKGVTGRAVLARVGLTPEEAADLGVAAASPDRADVPLSARDRAELTASLQRPDVAARVLARAREAADVLGAYLRQEGFTQEVPSALVDLGWRGHTARAFDAVLADHRMPAVQHLFLGLTADAGHVRRSSASTDMSAWLFDLDRRTGILQAERTAGLVTALESFCVGTQGRCLGYSMEGATVRPRLAADRNGPVLDWGLEEFRRVVLRFIDLVTPHVGEEHLHVDVATPSGRALQLFWTTPTSDEVAAWSSFPYEDETWPPYNPLGTRISTPDVLRRLARGDRNLRPVQSWRAGSAQVSPQPWRALLLAREWEARADVRYRRIPRRLKLELAMRRAR